MASPLGVKKLGVLVEGKKKEEIRKRKRADRQNE